VYGIVAAGLPVWAGFLIVGGAQLLIAVILGLIARAQFQKAKGPEGAIAAAQETKSALEAAVAAGKASAAGLPDPAHLPPQPVAAAEAGRPAAG
jgi:predicted lipid-binding transport protein (Tim44 family)